MQDKIKQINQLVEQVNKAQSLLRDVLQHYEEQQRPSVARRERDRRERNRCRCRDYFDLTDDEERERRPHLRDDRKRDRSHSRGRSRGHSRGRSHGRSRSRSHTNAAHRQLTLAVQV